MSPWVYFIPRNDVLTRVAPRDEGELRLVRTELELLKRIRIHVDRRCTGPRRKQIRSAPALQFSLDDLTELRRIVQDAERPIVEEMIALFDMEHGDIRKTLDFTSIDREAEKIAQQANKSGVITHLDIDELESSPQDHVPTVAEALAAAEAGLAQALAVASNPKNEPATPDQPNDDSHNPSVMSDVSDPTPMDHAAPDAIEQKTSKVPLESNTALFDEPQTELKTFQP